MKNVLLILLTILLFGAIAVYMLFLRPTGTEYSNKPYDSDMSDKTSMEDDHMDDNGEDTNTDQEDQLPSETLLGKSVEGRDLMAYHFGTGDTELLFVGGTHGGYSANTSELMDELVSYLQANPEAVPENVRVTVVPLLNPDGLAKLDANPSDTTAARFNANKVDLNRNFDCAWQAESTWRNTTVSGGDSAFSEPEAAAIRDYVESHQIAGAVVYYSAAGGVYASSCNNGVSAKTKALTNLYAEAAGYDAFEEFDYYEVTGDMVNWLAKLNIPAISVLLSNHETIEWNKNQAGIKAVLDYYSK